MKFSQITLIAGVSASSNEMMLGSGHHDYNMFTAPVSEPAFEKPLQGTGNHDWNEWTAQFVPPVVQAGIFGSGDHDLNIPKMRGGDHDNNRWTGKIGAGGHDFNKWTSLAKSAIGENLIAKSNMLGSGNHDFNRFTASAPTEQSSDMDGVGNEDYNEFTSDPTWHHPQVRDTIKAVGKIDIFGYTEIDVYDFTEGLSGSILKRDIRNSWQGCVEGLPEFFLSILDVYGGFKITNPLGPFIAMVDISKLPDVGHVVMGQAMKLPGEMASCKTVFTDISDLISFGMLNFSVSMISTGLLANITSNFMKVFGSAGVVMTSFVSHDFYKAGQNMGDVFTELFYNDTFNAHFATIKTGEDNVKAAAVAEDKSIGDDLRSTQSDMMNMAEQIKNGTYRKNNH